MRISVSPPGTGTTAIKFISAVQRQSGSSVEPASSRRSNFGMTPPVPVGKCMSVDIGHQVNSIGFHPEISPLLPQLCRARSSGQALAYPAPGRARSTAAAPGLGPGPRLQRIAPRRQNFRLKARTLALTNARRRGNSGILSGSASFPASFKI